MKLTSEKPLLMFAFNFNLRCYTMGVDMWDEVQASFDAIEPGLWGRIMDRSILEDEAYMHLVKPDDGARGVLRTGTRSMSSLLPLLLFLSRVSPVSMSIHPEGKSCGLV